MAGANDWFAWRVEISGTFDRNLLFTDVLARKVRHFAETGEPFARVATLFPK